MNRTKLWAKAKQYEKSNKYLQAVELYQKLADDGDVDARFRLAYFYEHGLGVEQSHLKAFEWYKKSADLGNVDAHVKLGEFYELGLGVGKLLPLAEFWYKKAMQLGSTQALVKLGLLALGSTPSKPNVAFDYFTKSANVGDAQGQYQLSLLY